MRLPRCEENSSKTKPILIPEKSAGPIWSTTPSLIGLQGRVRFPAMRETFRVSLIRRVADPPPLPWRTMAAEAPSLLSVVISAFNQEQRLPRTLENIQHYLDRR